MKIWHISDTHCLHRQILQEEKQDADVVVFSGDASSSRDIAINMNQIIDFLDWFSELPQKFKIFVPGNHDLAIWKGFLRAEDFEQRNIRLLINESCFYNDVHFWGSPYTPRLYDHYTDWAWGLKRAEMHKVWRLIPNNVDVLITHGPPKGILDLTDDKEKNAPVQAGDSILLRAVKDRFPIPKAHLFGHIHTEQTYYNTGILNMHGITFSNGACAGGDNAEELISEGNILLVN